MYVDTSLTAQHNTAQHSTAQQHGYQHLVRAIAFVLFESVDDPFLMALAKFLRLCSCVGTHKIDPRVP